MRRKESPGLGAGAITSRSAGRKSPENIEHDPAKQDYRPVFTITLRPEPGTDGIRALRRLLKRALRGYGLRALSCIEGQVVTAPIARIIPEREGGWLVITHKGHAWLHGDRQSALEDKRWLDAQWRRRA
jgi:hypothetical protein